LLFSCTTATGLWRQETTADDLIHKSSPVRSNLWSLGRWNIINVGWQCWLSWVFALSNVGTKIWATHRQTVTK